MKFELGSEVRCSLGGFDLDVYVISGFNSERLTYEVAEGKRKYWLPEHTLRDASIDVPDKQQIVLERLRKAKEQPKKPDINKTLEKDDNELEKRLARYRALKELSQNNKGERYNAFE